MREHDQRPDEIEKEELEKKRAPGADGPDEERSEDPAEPRFVDWPR